MTCLVIVTHGDFGAYLVEAAEMIVGAQSDGVELVSVSSRLSMEQVTGLVRAAVEKCRACGPVLLFTDMLGGTPTNASLPVVKDMDDVAVISGVNLNMLLSAFSYRGKLGLPELAKKVLEDGKKSVCDIKALFAAMGKKDS